MTKPIHNNNERTALHDLYAMPYAEPFDGDVVPVVARAKLLHATDKANAKGLSRKAKVNRGGIALQAIAIPVVHRGEGHA